MKERGRHVLTRREAKLLHQQQEPKDTKEAQGRKRFFRALLPAAAALGIAAAPAAAVENTSHQEIPQAADSGYTLRLPSIPTTSVDLDAGKAVVPGFVSREVIPGDTLSEKTASAIQDTDPARPYDGTLVWQSTALAAQKTGLRNADVISPKDKVKLPNAPMVDAVRDANKGIGSPDVVAAVQDLKKAVDADYHTAGDEAERVIAALENGEQAPNHSEKDVPVIPENPAPHVDQQPEISDSQSPIVVDQGSDISTKVGFGGLGVATAATLAGLFAMGRSTRRKNNAEVADRARNITVNGDPLLDNQVSAIANTLREHPQTKGASRRARLDGAHVLSEYATINPSNVEKVLENLNALTPENQAIIDAYRSSDHQVDEHTASTFGIPTVRRERDALVVTHQKQGMRRSTVYTIQIEKRTLSTGLSLPAQSSEVVAFQARSGK